MYAASRSPNMTHPPFPPDRNLPAPGAAPAERERVVAVLTQLFAHDQITEADLEQRLDRVYRATSAGELAALLADLPAMALPDTRRATPSATTGQRIAAFLSGQQRQLAGVVPRSLDLRARLGYVELDLTRATFAPGLTVIDVRAFMGYVQIRFPGGIRVESEGRAFAGFFSIKGGGGRETGASVVRVSGRASFGFAECYLSAGSGRSDSISPPGLDDPGP